MAVTTHNKHKRTSRIALALFTAFNLGTSSLIFGHGGGHVEQSPALPSLPKTSSDAGITILRPPSPIAPPSQEQKDSAHEAEKIKETLKIPGKQIVTTAPPPFINLPGLFEQSVRGCTTDGHVFRLSYNIAVNRDDLAASPDSLSPQKEQSLLYRQTQIDLTTRLGITGTNDFMNTLRLMTRDIHAIMNTTAGELIDSTSSETIGKDAFHQQMQEKIQTIQDNIQKQYKISVIFKTGTPKNQHAPCPPLTITPQSPPPKTPAP